jgi:hypothetical protein
MGLVIRQIGRTKSVNYYGERFVNASFNVFFAPVHDATCTSSRQYIFDRFDSIYGGIGVRLPGTGVP